MAARFWSVRSLWIQGGGDLQISGIELRHQGDRVDAGALFTCTAQPLSGHLQALPGVEVAAPVSFAQAAVVVPGFAFTWDFGVDTDVSELAVRAVSEASWPREFSVYSSSDGLHWQRVNGLGLVLGFPGFDAVATLSFSAVAAFDEVFHLDTDMRSDGGEALAVSGAVLVSSAQKKFGGGCLQFSGGHVVLQGGPFCAALEGDFCFEAWVMRQSTAWVPLLYTGAYEAQQLSVRITDTGYLQSFIHNGTNSYGLRTGGTLIAVNDWTHIVVARRFGVIRTYVNGVLQTEGAWTGVFAAGVRYFGTQIVSGTPTLRTDFLMDELALAASSPVYVGEVPVPVAPPQGRYKPWLAGLSGASKGFIAGAAHSGDLAMQGQKQAATLDVEHGGVGVIYGPVELYNQAGNISLRRRVRLHRSRDGQLVREVWSDTQGNYRFDGISQRYTYDVIAWDHEGLQQSVVANDLTPEVVP